MNLLFKIHLQNERNGHACTDISDYPVDRRNTLLFDNIALLARVLTGSVVQVQPQVALRAAEQLGLVGGLRPYSSADLAFRTSSTSTAAHPGDPRPRS